jgi:hypothetical protein
MKYQRNFCQSFGLSNDKGLLTLEINIENVKPVAVTFAQSGTVTHVNFCHQDTNDGISNKPAEHVAQERSFGVP